MSRFFWLILVVPILGWSIQPIKTKISMIGEPRIAVVSLQHAFSTIGYRMDIERISKKNSYLTIEASLIGFKSFNPKPVLDDLNTSGITVKNAKLKDGIFTFEADGLNGLWNATYLGSGEGFEVKKGVAAQWFRVEPGHSIYIEAPFDSKWYPDIAIFNTSMQLISSIRSDKSEDQMEFVLPEDAVYMKVSNTNGMKLLKEGMWIESKLLK